jgi:cysteine desulfurase/selenocysteine lyase
MPPATATDAKTLDARAHIVGLDRPVPLLDGSQVTYVNLDNAASTPPFVEALEAVNDMSAYYASVHRGSGFKSRLSTEAYEWARRAIARFVGADLRTHVVVFGKNTTEATNKLSYRLPLSADQVVVTTLLEHHSNDLPWRAKSKVLYARCRDDGRLDEDHFDQLLAEYSGCIGLVTVTGAANVTGYLQPVHRLAGKAHRAGAPILVDAAQLAPHRPIDMLPDDHPEHLDFVTLAAHKMYAPFGTGALVAPARTFAGAPEYSGGGTVDAVTLEEVLWAAPPYSEEAGSPNVLGAVAMAVAAQSLQAMGMDAIAAHESELLSAVLERLREVPRLRIYGESDPAAACRDKVGVVPFNIDGVPHGLVAAVLGYEWGVGVRNGCFCAHPYVTRLLGVGPNESARWRRRVLHGDRSELPGMVRLSFGCYNDGSDIDRLIAGLTAVAEDKVQGDYRLDSATGEYRPHGLSEAPTDYLPWLHEG